MIHYEPFRKFLVTRLEIYEQLVEIEARSELEARTLVSNGYGVISSDPVYHSNMDSGSWTIEEVK